MSNKNRQILFASRPTGMVNDQTFRLVETEMPKPQPGQVLVKNHFLSLDPYMRGRLNTGKSYVKGVEIGEVMVGETAGEVIESQHAPIKVGDHVTAPLGWQEYGAIAGEQVRKVDAKSAPLSYYLGVVGMPGCTAYFGLSEIGQPKAGETVVVSGAAGAVGGIAGQIAKMHGCQVVGIAGGKAKCDYVENELGFHACIDYRSGDLKANLQAAAPKGVDVFWDNVGGETLDVVLTSTNTFARVVVCGMISQYNSTEPYALKNYRAILVSRVKMQGMIVFDWAKRYPEAWVKLAQWVSSGKIKYRETVAQGLENAPRAFGGLLKGDNIGKQIVKLV